MDARNPSLNQSAGTQRNRRALLDSILRYGRQQGIIADPAKQKEKDERDNKQSFLRAIGEGDDQSERQKRILKDVVGYWVQRTEDAKERAKRVNEGERAAAGGWQSKWERMLKLIEEKVEQHDASKQARISSSEAAPRISSPMVARAKPTTCSQSTEQLLQQAVEAEKEETEDEETRTHRELTAKNAEFLKVAIEDVQSFYQKYRYDEYREGNLLLLMDEHGALLDYNHHIQPKVSIPHSSISLSSSPSPSPSSSSSPQVGEETPSTKEEEFEPNLYDDVVFESWYKTGQLFFKAIQNNPELWTLALQSIDEGWTPFKAKRRWKCPPGKHYIVFEVHVALLPISDDPSVSEGGLCSGCMCTCLEDYSPVMRYLPAQKKSILSTLNLINSTSRACLERFQLPPKVVCPYVFVLLEWSRRGGLHHNRTFHKNVRRYMGLTLPYMVQMYEKANSPHCLGLRGLLLDYREVFLGASSLQEE
ncbi:hypothetical protein QOT17_005705 [Balamuthia mandrillaris]